MLNAAVWFPVLAGVAVKSTAIVLMAGIAALLARRWSASARHMVWTAAAAALLALPLFSFILPAIPVHAPRALLADFTVAAHASPAASMATHHAIAAPTGPSATGSAQWSLDWPVILTLIWASGSLIALIQMLTACAGMHRLRRSAEPSPDQPLANELAATLGISHRVEVRETAGRSMPMTFGLLHPAIFMPSSARSWTAERRRVVLLHELAHVRRGDVAMHLLARLAVILNWWNPLAWIAWRQLVKESERAADDLVLNAGTTPADYAGHLLDVARTMQGMSLSWAAAPMARRSQLEGRLQAILDGRVNRRTVGRAAAFTAAAIAVALVLPLAAVRAQDSAVKPRPDVDATIRSAVAQSNFQMLDSAAGVFAAEREWDVARKLLDASLSIRQKASTVEYGVGLVNIGDLEKRRGRLVDAEPFYSKAAQTLGDRPQASRALIGLGVLALHAKNPDQAMSYFQSAQRIDPSQAGRAWMWMAVMREQQHNPVEAEAMYQSAMAVAPPDSPDAATIMDLYARFLTDNGRQAEAQPLLARARALQSRPKQLSQGAYKIGGDVKAPKIISKVEPEYTEEARLAKYQGTAALSVEIGPDGVPRNIQVVRGLGLGLDDNAVAAVSTWRFEPGTRNGSPVTVVATIEVNFKLY